jgi:EmrB/QacA subfamily drug resistance transporter
MLTAAQSRCDSARAEFAQAVGKNKHQTWILVATILASSLAFVDSSVVNVALPALARSFSAEASDLQWMINAYLLPLSSLLLLGGAAGDRFGRVKILTLGTVLFVLASIACAAASSLFWLFAARGLQGCGAALLMPNSLAILAGNFAGESRSRAVGIWASASGAAGAIGPVLGGWLVDTIDWRAIFLINVPLGLVAVFLALWFIEEQKPDGEPTPIDAAGALTATLAFGALTFGLTIGTGRSGWNSTASMALFIGVIFFVIFVIAERVKGDRAMVPLRLFASRDFVSLSLLTFLVYGALGVLVVLLPFELIVAKGFTATEAGTVLLPVPIVMAASSPLMGRLTGRFGSKVLLSVGPMIVAFGFLLLLRVDSYSGYWDSILLPVTMISLGMTATVTPLTTAILGSVDTRHTGAASGLNSAVARLGGLVAIALLGSILSVRGSALIQQSSLAWAMCASACIVASGCSFFLMSE